MSSLSELGLRSSPCCRTKPKGKNRINNNIIRLAEWEPSKTWISSKTVNWSAMPNPQNNMQKAAVRHIQQRYPLMVTDLSKSDLKLLVGALHTANPDTIKAAVKGLPGCLRKHLMIRIIPNDIIWPAVLCSYHRGLNPYVINHISRLLSREVIEHMKVLGWYFPKLKENVQDIVRRLQALQGIWAVSTPQSAHPPAGSTNNRKDQCEACKLAAIINEPMHLKNLRVSLLSRTRTRKRHQAPRLLQFIDEGINCHPALALDLFYKSGDEAYQVKAARKEAVKWFKLSGESRRSAKDLDFQGETHSILIWMEQNRKACEDEGSEAGTPRENKMLERYGDEDVASEFSTDETLIDEILATYASFKGQESKHSSIDEIIRLPSLPPLQLQKDLQLVPPLSVKKDPNAGSPAYGETVVGNMYIPPRTEVDWQRAVNQDSALRSLSKKAQDYMREKNGTTERLAICYRDLLSPRMESDLDCYSESEYTDAGVEDSSSGGTTWDLVCDEAQRPART